ncbi:hypothetical protein KIPB_012201 [Kipferlia bialata]|uniref:Uncharacterized protein n=1 Tax=Kipferlia bialata TaxID=797122 RepID=A0A391P043_9EUKA|nr:hypothetical protein KIPB_012201 [Kipferlia bialata]|eukprot:g12201.t1
MIEDVLIIESVLSVSHSAYLLFFNNCNTQQQHNATMSVPETIAQRVNEKVADLEFADWVDEKLAEVIPSPTERDVVTFPAEYEEEVRVQLYATAMAVVDINLRVYT